MISKEIEMKMSNRAICQIVRLALWGALIVAGVGAPARASFVAQFPTSSSTVSGSGTFGFHGSDIGYFFVTGNSVSQTYAGTGLNSVSELQLSINVDQNLLNSGGFVDLNVTLNGTTVGQFVRTDVEGTGITNLDLTFAPIVGGGTYTVGLTEINTVPEGLGSIAIAEGGNLTLNSPTAVPEPASVILLGLGSLGLVAHGLRRRPRQ
jgi:PEP-CTERM motif